MLQSTVANYLSPEDDPVNLLAVRMNPNIAAQGAKARASMAPPTSIMDPRYPAWKKSQDDAELLMLMSDMALSAVPLAGPAAALRYQQEQQPADPLESFRSLAGLKSAYERRVQPIINNAAQTFSTGGVIGDLLRSYGEAAAPAQAAVLKGMGMPYQGPMTAPREEGVTSGESFRPMGDPQQQFVGQLVGDPTNLAQPVGARLANALKFAKPDAMKMVKDLSMGAISPMDVWHGSPHRFPPTAKNPLGEFDASKIGTGEGAQAYGVGAGYLAEAKGTAKNYRDVLSADRGFDFEGKSGLTRIQVLDMVNAKTKGYLDNVSRPSGVADLVMDDMVLGTQKPTGFLPRQYKEGSERAKAYEQFKQDIKRTNQGSLYKVDLPDEQIAKMLDWDKPFNKQHPEVQQALVNIANGEDEGSKMLKLMQSGNPSGKDIFRSLLTEPQLIDSPSGWISVDNKKEISKLLQTEGIPGIRYLDQGSRSTSAGELIGVAKGADGWQAKIRKTPSGQVGDVIPMAPSITTSKSYPTEQAARDWATSQIGGGTSNFVVFDPKHMNIIGRE